jgi:hypothetical chaperone protein
MAGTPHATLGIDFGTSNSAVACVGQDGLAHLVPVEGSATGIPTAVFFNAEDRSIHFGREAIGLYLSGTEGRLMRSLKSLLGSSLLQEKTAVPEGLVSFQDIISRFLAELGERARKQLRTEPVRVVIGRPVHFVDDDPGRDANAQAALLKAADAAGFNDVSFELEPIAAAFDFERRVQKETLALIVDVGGGTSDFTVVRLGPGRASGQDRSRDILATTGVHVGGTDFDRRLSLEEIMPLLGFRHLGPDGREVPSTVFFDLATWHLINWLYTPRWWQQAQALRTNYGDTRLHQRLLTVLGEKLGHRLASEVEAAKIRTSTGQSHTLLNLSLVEDGLTAELTTHGLASHLHGLLQDVVLCARECMARAGLKASDVDVLYLTGGSCALQPLQTALRNAFPGTELIEGDLFGGVASGLAYSAVRR